MPTNKPRLNLTLNPDDMDMLAHFATKEAKSIAAVARDLIEEALELREDYMLAKLADQRMKEDTGTYHSHDEVWGNINK